MGAGAGLAGVLGAMSLPERAARLFGAAEALVPGAQATTYDSNYADYTRNLALVSAQLDENTMSAAWSEGRTLSVEQVIAEALADPYVCRAVGAAWTAAGRPQPSGSVE